MSGIVKKEGREEELLNSQKTIDKLVKGKSPLWIRFLMGILKIWFFLYDYLNYIPYELFNSPSAKLLKSRRVKSKSASDSGAGPWKHVDGMQTKFFVGMDTLDKTFTEAVNRYEDKEALGSRQLLEVHEEIQEDGRTFEKWVLGEYKWQTYREVHNRVGHIASGIKDIMNESGGSHKVVIYAETRADWLITALACFRLSIPVVTVYSTLGKEAIVHAVNETEATFIAVSAELLPVVTEVVGQCPAVKTIVYFPLVDRIKKLPSIQWLLDKRCNVLSLNELETRCGYQTVKSVAKKEDIAFIMYTSGTTGPPKGVILTNENLLAGGAGISGGIGIIRETDRYIGYLPLAHILEVQAEICCWASGCSIGYSSPLTLHDRGAKIKSGSHGDCWALRPTFMNAVPAVMDRIFKAVSDEVACNSRFMQELFKLNYERKRARYEEGYCSPFLDRIVFKKIRGLLGGKMRGVLSGGAALNPETQRFMNICMCCPVIQGYGLTETSCAASVGEVSDLSTGSVGPPVRCSQIILREWTDGGYSPSSDPPRGEILIGGPNVSVGYWKLPEKSAEDFVTIDGVRYFITGDIGEIREDGSLKIIDRKKDLIKLQHGEYVSLAKVETTILTSPLIDNICVYASPVANYVIAFVVPNQKGLKSIADSLSIDSSDWMQLCDNCTVKAEFKKRLHAHAIKGGCIKGNIPKKIHLCKEIWTPELDLLTVALKLKRRAIAEKYADVIDDLYRENGTF